MGFIADNSLLIIAILAILLLVTTVIILALLNSKSSKTSKNKNGVSKPVSSENYNKTKKELEKCRKENKKLQDELEDMTRKYSKEAKERADADKDCNDYQKRVNALEEENTNLKKQNEGLKRVNAENAKLNGQDPNPDFDVKDVPSSKKKEDVTPKDTNLDKVEPDNLGKNVESYDLGRENSENKDKDQTQNENTESSQAEKNSHKEEPVNEVSKEATMFASFPRTAGSSIYFSDITENIADDSFFELKISFNNGKATFKPLNFMRIRNFDAAMAAMITEGVKPNAASTVVGIEPGKSHLDNKVWIIDTPAKIKLA